MSTLEKIKAEIQKVIYKERDFTSKNAKAQALALFWVLELIDKYAEQEPKVTTTSTDEPMVIQYPQVYGITPTVVKAEQEPQCTEHPCLGTLCRYFKEPSDDAISREELLKAIDTWDKFGCNADTKLVPYQDHYIPYIHYDDVVECIKDMPSVRPQEQTKKESK